MFSRCRGRPRAAGPLWGFRWSRAGLVIPQFGRSCMRTRQPVFQRTRKAQQPIRSALGISLGSHVIPTGSMCQRRASQATPVCLRVKAFDMTVERIVSHYALTQRHHIILSAAKHSRGLRLRTRSTSRGGRRQGLHSVLWRPVELRLARTSERPPVSTERIGWQTAIATPWAVLVCYPGYVHAPRWNRRFHAPTHPACTGTAGHRMP
jgi:hypothetical protein